MILRTSVLKRLIRAQQYLSEINPKLQLALFDAWRPISVQKFMFNYAIQETCKLKGIDVNDLSVNGGINDVFEEVGRFWAIPSSDPLTPPPHSTGAAIDLTLADITGQQLDLGGEIDLIGPESSPDFYKKDSFKMPYSKYQVFHERRSLLFSVMEQAGFVHHPNEWWHLAMEISYGLG